MTSKCEIHDIEFQKTALGPVCYQCAGEHLKCEVHGAQLHQTAAGLVCYQCAESHLDGLNRSSRKENSKVFHESEVESKRVDKLKQFDRVGIPPRFRRKSLANYQADSAEQGRALKMVTAYSDRLCAGKINGGLVMSGNPGTGKTHLACAVANQYQESGKSVMFVTVAGMIRKIRETYRGDADMSEAKAIALFRDYDLLVLDEVGVQKGDIKEINLMTEVINERYGWEKPTILISNLTFQQMAELLQNRIIDRLREDGGMAIEFSWSSFRTQAGKLHREVA